MVKSLPILAENFPAAGQRRGRKSALFVRVVYPFGLFWEPSFVAAGPRYEVSEDNREVARLRLVLSRAFALAFGAFAQPFREFLQLLKVGCLGNFADLLLLLGLIDLDRLP